MRAFYIFYLRSVQDLGICFESWFYFWNSTLMNLSFQWCNFNIDALKIPMVNKQKRLIRIQFKRPFHFIPKMLVWNYHSIKNANNVCIFYIDMNRNTKNYALFMILFRVVRVREHIPKLPPPPDSPVHHGWQISGKVSRNSLKG